MQGKWGTEYLHLLRFVVGLLKGLPVRFYLYKQDFPVQMKDCKTGCVDWWSYDLVVYIASIASLQQLLHLWSESALTLLMLNVSLYC